MTRDWTAAELEYLRRWWGTLSAGKISETLGRTRNGVIGMAHRAGLPNLGNPVGEGRAKHAASRAREPYKRRDENGKLKVKGTLAGKARSRASLLAYAATCAEKRAKRDREAAPISTKPEAVVPIRPRVQKAAAWDGKPIAIASIEHGQCRYVVGNEGHGAATLMCAAPTQNGDVYCATHAARCYTGFGSSGHARVDA